MDSEACDSSDENFSEGAGSSSDEEQLGLCAEQPCGLCPFGRMASRDSQPDLEEEGVPLPEGKPSRPALQRWSSGPSVAWSIASVAIDRKVTLDGERCRSTVAWLKRLRTMALLAVQVFLCIWVWALWDHRDMSLLVSHIVCTSIVFTCWLIFDMAQGDAARMMWPVWTTLLLEWVLAWTPDAFLLWPPALCPEHLQLLRPAWFYLFLSARTYCSMRAVSDRMLMVEGALEERLGSRSLDRCRGVVVLVMLLWPCAGAVLLIVSRASGHCIEVSPVLGGIIAVYQFACDACEVLGWVFISAVGSQGLRYVRNILRESMLEHPSCYVYAEAMWAMRVVQRTLFATGVYTAATSAVAVSRMFSVSLEGEVGGRGNQVRCVVYSVVDLSTLLITVGFFLPVRPDTEMSRVLTSTSSSRTRSRVDTLASSASTLTLRDDAWSRKVLELAGRSLTVESLLDFYRCLGTTAMPHYDPLRHTTNDVVRAAIVPASRGRSGGVAYTALLEAPCEETRPSCLVTHDWRNLFVHLVAAVVADALGMQEYNDVASMLIRGRADALARRLKENAKMDMRYWICAFCVNQHSSICGGFGGPPGEEGSAEYERWDANRRDSVTGDLHRCCPCAEPKLLNDSPEHTELNKFDDVMALLFVEVPDFRQLVAVDREFNLFTRLWCVAELVQAYFSGIPQNVCLHVSSALDVDAGDTLLYNKLADLTVTNCRATRPEDKEAILAKIPDTAEFDAQLQNMIFCERGLFGKKLVGFDIPRTAALIARRVKALPVEKEASGATPTGRRAPWRTAWQHMTSRLSMESAGEP